jgi:uncharacterized protein YbbC (DUF1343 family)
VGLYPIPVQHGMTVGELALMIRGEGWLPGLDSLELDIVRMEGWARDRIWPDLGREWIPTSPNIPTFEAALVYPGTCFIEGTTASEGRGTETPFLLIGAPWLDAARVESLMTDAGLSGVEFHQTRFTPVSIPGKDTHPKHENVELSGIHIGVTDPHAVRPLAVGIHLLSAFATDPGAPENFVRAAGLARLSGSDRLASFLAAGTDPDSVIVSWGDEVAAFELARRPYLLYE